MTRQKIAKMKEGPTILLITKDRFGEPTISMKTNEIVTTTTIFMKTIRLFLERRVSVGVPPTLHRDGSRWASRN
jgi:hypothetical protein